MYCLVWGVILLSLLSFFMVYNNILIIIIINQTIYLSTDYIYCVFLCPGEYGEYLHNTVICIRRAYTHGNIIASKR